jgi:hypothetical protein
MSDQKCNQNLGLKSCGLRLEISTRRFEDIIKVDVVRNRMGEYGPDTDWLGAICEQD